MYVTNRITRVLDFVCAFVGLRAPVMKNLVEKTAQRSHLHCIATLASTVLNTPMSDKVLRRNKCAQSNGEYHETTSDDDFGKRSACRQPSRHGRTSPRRRWRRRTRWWRYGRLWRRSHRCRCG